MAITSSEPVLSGFAYNILTVADGEPATLDQFLGETMFTIHNNGSTLRVAGCGSPRNNGLRFQEKAESGTGKDVRAWEIVAVAGGGFTATAVSAF